MSRPWAPKPFNRLLGDTSGFQAAITLAHSIAFREEVLVVGAASHRRLIETHLAGVGCSARSILEPAGRDTAPAIAAAAIWVARRNPAALMIVLPADQFLPASKPVLAAFDAALAAADDGGLIVLGLPPREPSSAFGYILPVSGPGNMRPLSGFEEKPSFERAVELIAAGGLWNSGVFVAQARTLVSEFRRLAPDIASVSEAAIEAGAYQGQDLLLGPGFVHAPRLSFDHAIMEHTDRAMVLPVDFPWSDLGGWDAVLAASERDSQGNSSSPGTRLMDANRVLVRAPQGTQVAVVGVSRVAVVIEPGSVLVCALDADQAVRDLGEGPLRGESYGDLAQAANSLEAWLGKAALPLWATVGMDSGAFREALTLRGEPADPFRRTLVQARQAFVFATAASDGIVGPWDSAVRVALEKLKITGRRPDGLYVSCCGRAGDVTDPAARLYENAFVLLALSALHRLDPQGGAAEQAVDLRVALNTLRHSAGGFREVGEREFQANANMHLLEAVLAWEALSDDAAWRTLADELVELALSRFVDAETGALAEFYDSQWRRLEGDAALVEPGHQFEWAWLLTRWGKARRDPRGEAAARRLFDVGRGAYDPRRGVVVNGLWPDLSTRDAGARLWPQTEHLKAALILGEDQAALQAANGLMAYIDTPVRGVWRERMRPDGGFLDEPSPASSLYHLFLAIRELTRYPAKPC